MAGAAWFQTAIAGQQLTLSLTDAGRALASGRYEAQYTVTSGALASRGAVTLEVPVAALAIEAARIATDARMEAGCPLPTAAGAVSEAVPAVYWFIARGVAATDQLTIRWTSPGGLVESANLSAASGSYCYAASFDPKRVEAARRYGEWKAELTWNGARQPAMTFVVNPELRLIGSVCPDEASVGRIPICPQFREAPSAGQLLRLQFRRPDGEVDGQVQAAWRVGQRFDYVPVLASAGVWRVDVTADGAAAGTVEVPVAAAVEVRRAEIVDRLRVEFALGGVADGTRGRVEFVEIGRAHV